MGFFTLLVEPCNISIQWTQHHMAHANRLGRGIDCLLRNVDKAETKIRLILACQGARSSKLGVRTAWKPSLQDSPPDTIGPKNTIPLQFQKYYLSPPPLITIFLMYRL